MELGTKAQLRTLPKLLLFLLHFVFLKDGYHRMRINLTSCPILIHPITENLQMYLLNDVPSICILESEMNQKGDRLPQKVCPLLKSGSCNAVSKPRSRHCGSELLLRQPSPLSLLIISSKRITSS